MLTWGLLVALLAALFAGVVTGTTGFGLALISTPILLFVYEPKTVIFLTAVFSVVISGAVVWDSWRDAHRTLALTLLPPACVGIVAGAEVLRLVDPTYIRLAVGAVVVLSALLLIRDVRLPGADTRWAPVVAGSASGALSTSTGLAGPPIVLLLASRGLPKHQFRGTSAFYFLLMSAITLIILPARGLVAAEDLRLAAALVPAAIVGKAIGTAFLERISEGAFRTLSLGLVILTGALGVATAAWALL